MVDIGLSFFDFLWLVIVIAVSLICFGISMYSVSRKERQTQFHELWYIADGKSAASKRNSKTIDFEA